jgi:hypothetical protein
VFNVSKRPFQPSIGAEARRLLEELEAKVGPAGGGKVAAGDWKRGFDGAPFTPLEERHVDHENIADRERVVARLVSSSAAAALPEPARRALAEALRAAIPDREYRDEIDTQIYGARRL